MPDNSPAVVTDAELDGDELPADEDDEPQPATAATQTDAPSRASIALVFIQFAPGT
jgi:hypothetical protein